MNIIFEKANILDASKLIEVQDISFKDDFIKYGECPAYGESIEKMEESINTRIVYKILHQDRIIGDIIIRERPEQEFYLRILSIIPEYQNKGIGKMTFDFMFKNYPNVVKWSLITPKDNIRNCYFYEKIGFRKVSEEVKSDILTINTYVKES